MRPQTRTLRAGSEARANGTGVQAEDTRICVVMVGLPARGKSLIAQKGRQVLHSLARVMTRMSAPQPSNWHADSNDPSRSLSWLA